MDWVVPCITGWFVGVIIIIIIVGGRIPKPPKGPCIVCGAALGLIGAVILEMLLRQQIAGIGLGERILFDSVAAGFAVTLGGVAMDLMSRGQVER
jgi:hypothetical protein